MKSYKITIPSDQKWKLEDNFPDFGIVCFEQKSGTTERLVQHIFAGQDEVKRTLSRQVSGDNIVVFVARGPTHGKREGKSVVLVPKDGVVRREIVCFLESFSFMTDTNHECL